MTLAEIFADTKNLPAGVEPIILNGQSFAHWEMSCSYDESIKISVTLWCNRCVQINIPRSDDEGPYPRTSFTLSAEQTVWLGSLPNMLG